MKKENLNKIAFFVSGAVSMGIMFLTYEKMKEKDEKNTIKEN